eukprot:1990365-Rhodomonas_salina.1
MSVSSDPSGEERAVTCPSQPVHLRVRTSRLVRGLSKATTRQSLTPSVQLHFTSIIVRRKTLMFRDVNSPIGRAARGVVRGSNGRPPATASCSGRDAVLTWVKSQVIHKVNEEMDRLSDP